LSIKQAIDRIEAAVLTARVVAGGNMNYTWKQDPAGGVEVPCRSEVKITPLPTGTDPL
jgi:hypothetical protein